ncbi:endonuclease (plasmid) [Persicobacter psychrovividus]|uniref:Endonuclease n=2 Tax=Persicobacter psychrovividus TaxID=387638 RepID=A0ABN6LFC7_9BACT|nr:endonuclease [Persicobacter psychrovividus]
MMSFLPSLRVSHWTFRFFDFVRLQVVVIQLLLFVVNFYFMKDWGAYGLYAQLFLGVAMLFQAYIIAPYFPLNLLIARKKQGAHPVTMISTNVLQKNKDYHLLIAMVKKHQPDILLTMESNQRWEDALSVLEQEYSYCYKIPKENRYGMHFYTKLPVKHLKEHYFISEDRPAIHVQLQDQGGRDFSFWGIHPPPPSPTEKPTSAQKDAELMMIAKQIRELETPCLVAGDFNNVCWSRSSRLFSEISTLNDARIKNGFHNTFPATVPIFRFPLDLLFNSKEIAIEAMKVMPSIGSDHFPLFAKFSIQQQQTEEAAPLEKELEHTADEIIKKGEQALDEEGGEEDGD